MPTLTHNEAQVLDVVRRQSRQGDPVATGTVRRLTTVSYDGVDYALRGLMAKGLVTKPSRGNWLPVVPNEEPIR